MLFIFFCVSFFGYSFYSRWKNKEKVGKLFYYPLTILGGVMGLVIAYFASFPLASLVPSEEYVLERTKLDRVPYYENNLKMFSYIVRVMTDNETIIYYSPEKSYMMSSLEDTMNTDIVEGEECCDEAYLIKYRKKFKKHWMKYLIPEDPSITNYKFVVPKGEVKRFQVNKSLM